LRCYGLSHPKIVGKKKEMEGLLLFWTKKRKREDIPLFEGVPRKRHGILCRDLMKKEGPSPLTIAAKKEREVALFDRQEKEGGKPSCLDVGEKRREGGPPKASEKRTISCSSARENNHTG